MNTREGQPSGLNPDREADKGQNIAIARKIDEILLKFLPRITEAKISLGDRRGFTLEDWIYERIEPQSLSAIEHLVAEEVETIGRELILKHVDNSERTVLLAIGKSREYLKVYSPFNDIFPEDFNFPIYIIANYTSNLDDDASIMASSQYGKTPNDIIGDDGLWYMVGNYYCFNSSGQGVKVETITSMGYIEDRYDFEDQKELDEAYQRLIKVNFIPQESDSRAVPATPEDYARIKSVFEQIDADLYSP